MSRNRIINKPYDFAFRILYNEYPKELYEELRIPGIFRQKSNVKASLKTGKLLEMDASYVVDPDFKILFEPAVVDLEHQSTPVDIPKIIIIGEYNIQQIADERLPPLNVIASHLDEGKSVKEFERTPTNTTKLLFLNLGRQDNEKRLSNLKNIIINHKEYLTINDAINLGIIVLFAPRDIACEITRQVVELYLKIDKSKKLEYTLYCVIGQMIDAYFDDEDEFEELMNMINSQTGKEIIGKFESEIISQNRLALWEEEVGKANARADEAEVKADEANAENIRLKAKIKELENQLNK